MNARFNPGTVLPVPNAPETVQAVRVMKRSERSWIIVDPVTNVTATPNARNMVSIDDWA
ncbi:hypothetical protein [Paeniglutamicibacter kerguelensis]|uniref:Uncharacterized protein n=1 Tax=Paeniglutamicibacter kerguelensis TaxID=254788 RepID=A0ABS4XAY0_9MICC|nr:hypothetical protein [Paeniglutamicibacter kerguelensis]MBP2385633.1 hypothetical protein [Paeniglutamicibacter kerguelensis]